MKAPSSPPTTVDEYIDSFPLDVQSILQNVRTTIKKAAPDAVETIKYGIPTFVQNGNLVHFGGYKKHIGFYPAPSGIEQFQDEMASYKGAKGSVQFPLDKPIPYDLIAQIVRFRVTESSGRAESRKIKQFQSSAV